MARIRELAFALKLSLRLSGALSVTLLMIPFVATPSLAARDDRAAIAKQHYETGMAHYQLEEWDQAITEWETGFRTKPAPQFLYNIAQAYRLSKRPEKALNFYQKYLHMDPNARNKAEVEEHMANLTRAIDEQKKASSSPPLQPLPAEGPPAAPERAVTTKPPARSNPAPLSITGAPPEPAPPETPESKPVYKKGWFWGAVAGAAVVVAAGVTVGVVLGTADNTSSLPAVSF